MSEYHVFEADGGYRWRYVDHSGATAVTSLEVYPRLPECQAAIETLKGSWSAKVLDMRAAEKRSTGEVRQP